MRISVLLLFLVSVAVFGQSKTKATSLFKVGSTTVNTDEFIYLYKKNHQSKPEDFTQVKVEEYLDLYVNFKLKVSEAMRRGLDTTASFRQEFDQYREEIKKPYVSEGDDLDRLVKEAYQRFTEQVHPLHILLNLKTDATPADTLALWNKLEAIRKRAVAGEDFVALAKEFSDDPGGKANGGDLGYFSAFEMVYPFETMAFNTKTGDISPIVKTKFGYHIIKVLDHRPSLGEVEVSHIMIRTGQGDDAKARNTTFEINDQLKAGREWSELCKEYSEDPNTKNTGGRLRQFGMGAFTNAAPEFENAAFALKNVGDVSDPIQTKFGWHLLRLEKKVPVQTFKEMQPSLSRRVARDERLQLSKTSRLNKLKLQFGFTENEAIKKGAFSLGDTTFKKAKWNYSPKAIESTKTIAALSNKNYPAKDFLEYVKKNQVANTQAPTAYMSQQYNKWIEHLLNMAEEEKLIKEKPEFRSIITEYKEGILLFTIMEKEIWNKASNDSIGQHKFYEAHLDKYKAGNRVLAKILGTDDKKLFDEIKNKIAIGDTLKPTDIKKLKTVSNQRAYEKGDSKVVDNIPWTVGMQETNLDAVYYLVEVASLVPPGIKSFDDARAGIISDFQDALEKEWIVQLKKKYPVTINKKGKATVMAELTTKK